MRVHELARRRALENPNMKGFACTAHFRAGGDELVK
jgi:hypothetical protein